MKRNLKALARWMVAEPGLEATTGQGVDAGGEAAILKVFVDTAPVMEKPLAEAAGLGWQGKHTNLVSREHGSWLFLGAIYTTLDADARGDAGQRFTCGLCDACQRACPTERLSPPPTGSMRGGASPI